MAERNRLRIAAVFAANADFQSGLRATATLGPHGDELAHAVAIEHLERVVSHDLPFNVSRQEAAGIVAAQAKRGLRKIVCAKREELRMRRDGQALL